MSSMLIEVSNVVNTHVRKAVMEFNVSKFQEDIEKCSTKIQHLETELSHLTIQESDVRTRLQETTYRIGISLIEQELISHRKKLQSMQEDLNQARSTVPDTISNTGDVIQNIMLDIQELPVQVTDNVLEPLEEPDENDQLVQKANDIMSAIHSTTCPSLVVPEVVSDGDIYEIMPEEEEEEEEEGVFEIDVDGVSYYTTGEENGSLYSIDVNGDPDVYVGRLQDGKAVLGSE